MTGWELREGERQFLTSLPPDEITIANQQFHLRSVVDGGAVGVVWRATDDWGRERAVKFTPTRVTGDGWRDQIRQSVVLDDVPEMSRFFAADELRLRVNRRQLDVVAVVEEWVDGTPLERFLQQRPDALNASFVVSFVDAMCRLLSALNVRSLCHDDLHASNVMVCPPPRGSMEDRWTIKVVDRGSVKPTSHRTATAGTRDDHMWFVEHVVGLHNTMKRQRALGPQGRALLREMVPLLMRMVEDDHLTALRAPDEIIRQFQLALTRASRDRSLEPPQLRYPFEYISAEQVAHDEVLLQTFAREYPWLRQLNVITPQLMTGPRGCGKSTVFRWLALRTHLRQDAAKFRLLRISGFYISCSADLQNRIGWIKDPDVATELRGHLVHYFNLLLIREIIRTLQAITERRDRDSAFGCGPEQERVVYQEILRLLHAEPVLFRGVPLMAQLLHLVERQMFDCHSAMLQGTSVDRATPETTLGDLTAVLTRNIVYFQHRPIVFLVDDFSDHRIPEPVQRVLVPVIWDRRDTHGFKLSSEKRGAILTDRESVYANAGREMVEVDCGSAYIRLGQKERVAFVKDLLDSRLKACGYKGRTDDLIGPSTWDPGGLGTTIRNGSRDHYHGVQCMADLCSGDISTLLLVFRRIFERGGVTPESTTRVARHVQHDAIVAVSRELLNEIRTHFPHGEEMHRVVEAFGTLVGDVLRHGRLEQHGKKRRPVEMPRIEVDRSSSTVAGLGRNRGLYEELVRRAVFIEMDPGTSRNRVTTLRWHLRRIFLPAFGASLHKTAALKMDPKSFHDFLSDPWTHCQTRSLHWPSEGNATHNDNRLFNPGDKQ